jgi:hypothetical protein
MPSVDVSAPSRSNRPGRLTVSGSTRGAAYIINNPIGTLMNNPQRQLTQSVNMPPRTRPAEPPPPATAE